MFKVTPILVFVLITFASSTQAKNIPEVMLMGSFHFANPGLDSVKTEKINVMNEESQKYLQRLTKKIATFKPTIVLLEFDESDTQKINDQYQQYLKGEYKLPANEIYQIGFRVAKLAGVKAVASFDERDVGWSGGALFEYMEKKDQQSYQRNNQIIAELSQKIEHLHKTLSLQKLLQLNNNDEEDNINKSLYIGTNHVGAEAGNFVGADASASWWHRNFRMYAKIQMYAQKHQKIFALGGQAHTAIIKDLIAIDESIQGISVEPLLK